MFTKRLRLVIAHEGIDKQNNQMPQDEFWLIKFKFLF